MSCEMIRAMLSDYMDGYLPDEDARQVTAHLAECEACGAEYDALKGLQEEVGKLPVMKAPAGFKEAVLDQLEDARESRDSTSVRRPLPFRRLMPVALVAASVLIAFSAYLIIYSPMDSESPARETAYTAQDKRSVPLSEKARLLETDESVQVADRIESSEEAAAGGLAKKAVENRPENKKGKQARSRFKDEEKIIHQGLEQLKSLGYEGMKRPGEEAESDGDAFIADAKTESLDLSGEFPEPAEEEEQILSSLHRTMERSGMDALVVMGSDSWSMPEELVRDALTEGKVDMGLADAFDFEMRKHRESSPEPAREEAKGLTGMRNRATNETKGPEVDKESLETGAGTGPGEPDASKGPKGPGVGKGPKGPGVGKGSKEPGVGKGPASPLDPVVVGGDEASQWDYIVFEGTEAEIDRFLSRLVQSQPDALFGTTLTMSSDEIPPAREIAAKAEAVDRLRYSLGEPRMLWSRPGADGGEVIDDAPGSAGPSTGRGRTAVDKEALDKPEESFQRIELKPNRRDQSQVGEDLNRFRGALPGEKIDTSPRRKIYLFFPRRAGNK